MHRLAPPLLALASVTFLAACASGPPTVTTGPVIGLVPAAGLQTFREPAGDWRNVGNVRLNLDDPRKLEVADSLRTGVLINGGGKTTDLVSNQEFGDAEVRVEFMTAKGSNSGVYVMGRYEVQILDSFGKAEVGEHDNGAIYRRWDPSRGKGNEGYEGRPPRVNASKHPGQWQTLNIIFRAPRFDAAGNKIANARFEKVFLNDILIHENVQVTGPTRGGWDGPEPATGPLRFQGDHGPVALRNILVREINLQHRP